MHDRKVVVKLGGSLLVQDDLAAKLSGLLDEFGANDQINLIVGGGPIVDAIRQLDRVHRFDAAWAHWLCIDALGLTFKVIQKLCPNWEVIDSSESLDAHRQNSHAGRFLIAIDSFYRQGADGHMLPCNWNTTSDSISAILAKTLAADQLVVVKSCAIAPGLSVATAVKHSVVDDHFSTAANGLDVTFRSIQSVRTNGCNRSAPPLDTPRPSSDN